MRGMCYRFWSKLIHHYGYHYAPRNYPPEPHQEYIGIDGKLVKEWFHWCQWCGLRGRTYEIKE